MALDAGIGGNSYVTEVEATAYFADSLRAESWTAFSSKEAALVDATNYIVMLGVQNLDGTEIVIGETIPDAIKQSTYELALHMGLNVDAFVEEDLTTRIKAGPFELENEIKDFGSLSSLPLRVRSLLNPYLSGGGLGGFCLELQ